jgi:hypothetical protein
MMVRLVMHRQTKGAATDRPHLRSPRHILTLPTPNLIIVQMFNLAELFRRGVFR